MKPQGLYVSPSEFVAFAEGDKKQRLSDHIATRDRSPDFTALGMYLPNPDPILKKQGKDIAIYTDLRSDAHVGGTIRRRKAGILTMEWRINRGKSSARMTKLCESVLQGFDMRCLLREILDAPLFGWQPLEIIWTHDAGGPIVPLKIMSKPTQWFHFDSEAQLRFKSRSNPHFGETVPPNKFLVPAQDASYLNPYGFADLSMCFWPTVFKRGGLKFWVTFTEKYGTPWLVGKTPRGTPGSEQHKLLDQLEAMVQDAVAVIPDDASVNIVESAGKTASAELYERLLMFCRSEISIALLGQNQTTEATANLASSTSGLQVANELRDADARLVEAAINQLLRWIVDLNEGEAAAAPKFELYEQEEIDTVQADRDEKLVRAGARLTPQYFKRVYKLEEGDLDETPPLPPVAKPTPAAGDVAFADATPGTPGTTDALDAIIDAEMTEWSPILDPLIAPLQVAIDQAVANGETAQQLLQRLPDILGQMDSTPLQEAMTHATYTARLGAMAGLPLDAAAAAPQPEPIGAATAFAEPPAANVPAPAAIELHVHPVIQAAIQLPQQAAPIVQVTNHIPEQAPPTVQITNPAQPAPEVNVYNQVQPAGVTVVDSHPSRAVQTVDYDAQGEISRTVTVYEK